MLSESAARTYWPGQNPIGRRLAMGSKADSMSTVIGVVPDTRYRDLRVARPTIYFPLAQSVFPFAPTSLAISTTGDPASIVPSLRRVLSETAPGMSLVRAAPFDAYLSGPLASRAWTRRCCSYSPPPRCSCRPSDYSECSRHRCVSGRAKSVSGSRSERHREAWRRWSFVARS